MTTTLQQRVVHTLRHGRMVAPGARVGVAVSGGADSVALFLLLQEVRAELGCVLAVVHMNHQLRGAEADADEQFARDLAQKAEVEFLLRRCDVAGEATRHKWNLEDAGRRLRTGFFQELVQRGQVDCVAVAHTADDQAETVLAHLLRGTGIAGLAGIHPVAGCVIRPLLEVRRAELRAYLAGSGQAWREDASNLDTARLRARLRQQLIPHLEAEYQPALTERLCQLAGIARGEEEYWQSLLDELAPRLSQRDATGVRVAADRLATADASSPAGLPVALARRLVRRLARDAGAATSLSAEQVERVLELAATGHSGQRIELPGSHVVERAAGGWLHFALREPETKGGTPSYRYDVGWPVRDGSAVEVAEVGSRFRLKLIDWPAAASETSLAKAPLDAGLLAPPLVLRSWRPGDAYRPVGHRRARKLKELLYRARVEAARRPSWPVLESAGRVVWSRGLPPAAECAAREGTRQGLVIGEERIEG